MTELYQLLSQLQSWHWLCLAITCLVIDALATGGFLLGVAAAAVAMWLIKMMFSSITWQLQLALFSVLSIVFSVLYNRTFKDFNEITDVSNINNRAAQMIGKQITLLEDVPIGQSKIQIGDTFWKVNARENYTAGQKVTISGAQGMEINI